MEYNANNVDLSPLSYEQLYTMVLKVKHLFRIEKKLLSFKIIKTIIMIFLFTINFLYLKL